MGTITDRPVRRHPLLEDRDWLQDRYANGRSMTQIAAELGVSSTSVHRAMRRVDTRTRPRPKPDLIAQQRLRDVAWLAERWFRDHARLSELSAEIGAAPSTVWLALCAHGIAEREVTTGTRQRMSASAKTRPPVTPESSVRRMQAQQARRARERNERHLFHIALLAVLLDAVAQQQERRDQRRADQLAAPKPPAVIVREVLDTYRRHGVPFEDGLGARPRRP